MLKMRPGIVFWIPRETCNVLSLGTHLIHQQVLVTFGRREKFTINLFCFFKEKTFNKVLGYQLLRKNPNIHSKAKCAVELKISCECLI